MPPTPTEANGICASEDDLAAMPADTDSVDPCPAIEANDPSLVAKDIRRKLMLGPTNGADELIFWLGFFGGSGQGEGVLVWRGQRGWDV